MKFILLCLEQAVSIFHINLLCSDSIKCFLQMIYFNFDSIEISNFFSITNLIFWFHFVIKCCNIHFMILQLFFLHKISHQNFTHLTYVYLNQLKGCFHFDYLLIKLQECELFKNLQSLKASYLDDHFDLIFYLLAI